MSDVHDVMFGVGDCNNCVFASDGGERGGV